MDKERYIGESKLKDEVKKKLTLKIKEGSVTPEHLSDRVVDEVIQPLVDDAKEGLQEQIDSVISEGMSTEDREKLDNLPTPAEFEALEAKVDAIKGFNYQVVATLPQASAETEGTIYLIPSTESEEQNIKDEYITIKDGNTYKWEQIGSTAIDLSGYATTEAVNAKYTKPNTGIPASDLASAVQTSLGKADTALQSQDLENCAIIGNTFAPGVDPSANFNAYSDTVWNKQQTLSESQKTQIRSNIDAASASDLDLKADKSDTYTKAETNTLLAAKQNTLTFDTTPTALSTKPVTSGGVYTALQTKAAKATTLAGYGITDAYTKGEVNNLIVPASTTIQVVSSLPASGVANTIYRVAGDPNAASYTDYGWNGTQFVPLAVNSNTAAVLTDPQVLTRKQMEQAKSNVGLNTLISESESTSLFSIGKMQESFAITASRTNYGNFELHAGVKYTMSASISAAVANYVSIAIRTIGGSTDLFSFRIEAGNTSNTYSFTPAEDYTNACFSIYSSSWSSLVEINVGITSDNLQKRVISPIIYAGATNIAPSTAALSKFLKDTSDWVLSDMQVYATISSWRLLPSGSCASDSTAQLKKYQVSAGQLIYVNLAKDTTSVYQFQNNASVPSMANNYLVGMPIAEAADGIMIVPQGATYLIVSSLKTNTSNKVQSVTSAVNSIASELYGEYTAALNFGTDTVAQYALQMVSYNVVAGHKYKIEVITTNNTDTTYFSTRTDSTHTVDTDISVGIGSRTAEFTASGNAQYIGLSYRYAGSGSIYTITITDLDTKSICSNAVAIRDLESRIGGGISMPTYAITEQNRVYDVLVNLSQSDVHIAAFNTDQHFNIDSITDGVYNPKWVMQGVQAMLNIANLLPIDEIVFGGDVAGYGGTGTSFTPDGIMQTISYLLQPTHSTNAVVVSLPGNHDAWQNNNQVTAQGMYNVNSKRNQRHTFYKGNGTDNCDAWVDDTEHKIRSIYVDVQSRNTRTEDYHTFLANALATLPEGYMAVCYSHMALTNEFAGVVKAQKISDSSVEIDAFQDPFDCHEILNQYANKIICCICGHAHFDASAVSEAGILYIETTTAAPHTRTYTTDNIPNTSTLQTVTDTSFDFFVIDQAAQTIEAVRYGGGCNRKWIYKGENAGMMSGYPQAIVRD